MKEDCKELKEMLKKYEEFEAGGLELVNKIRPRGD